MAWGSTPLWRKTEKNEVTEQRTTFAWNSETGAYVLTRQTKTDTYEQWEATGLSMSAAQSQAAAHGGAIIARSRMDDSGQWRVVEEKVTAGAWA